MPTTYTDQTFDNDFDPGNPPGLPASVTVIPLTLYDSNDDGLITANGTDEVNGSEVTRVWNGDTITMGGITVTGTTFYTADGSRYFTPNDGTILTDGTITSVTYVTTSTSYDLADLGPPCFVTGTRISTPHGARDVADLEVGDLVITRDHGVQPIRWIGTRTVGGEGKFAPVLFEKGAAGNTRPLFVSPNHRMVVEDWRSQLYLGEDEVFCAANSLVNGDTIRVSPRKSVTYVHLMFAQHDVIYAEGAATESFLVGDVKCGEGSATQAEILEIFPELMQTDALFNPALPVAKNWESRVLAVA